MIHLCIDSRMIFSSGIGTCIQNLIPYFSKPPFQLTLLGAPTVENVTTIPFDSPIYSLREQLSFPSKIPPCDLFWSPHYNTPWLPIKSRSRVVTIHDVCHLALPLSWPKKRIAKLLLKGACRHSEKIITDSHFSKSELIRYLGCKEEEIEMIYPGVNIHQFSPHHSTDEFKKKYDLTTPFFLFVGNFKAHKNTLGLIKAFEQLNPSDCHLILAGNSRGLLPSILEYIKKSPLKKKIRLFGEVSKEDLPLLYRSAKALVFPSLYEGFGLPPLEAMASGCPVLASNAASIPEVCSEAALYFDPNSTEEISSQMEKILRDELLRTKLIDKGLLRCKAFSWEETAKKYQTVFKNLCA